eukprot:scaffold269725_cov33-Tisochrysis_lutea.AAC.2
MSLPPVWTMSQRCVAGKRWPCPSLTTNSCALASCGRAWAMREPPRAVQTYDAPRARASRLGHVSKPMSTSSTPPAQHILGGRREAREAVFGARAARLFLHRLPWQRARWRDAAPVERAVWKAPHRAQRSSWRVGVLLSRKSFIFTESHDLFIH